MHIEVLVEDESGKRFLDSMIPKLIGDATTFRVLPYKGIGRIPKDLAKKSDPSHRILLNNLPRLLRGYGKTFASYGSEYRAALVVVCDLDDRSLKTFSDELTEMLKQCNPSPDAHFCIAVEEGEAWLLGDFEAIKTAYPDVDLKVLRTYKNDSICGTWEKLADALYPGGAQELKKFGWMAIGREKFRWATAIAPHMKFTANRSPSFKKFTRCLTQMSGR